MSAWDLGGSFPRLEPLPSCSHQGPFEPLAHYPANKPGWPEEQACFRPCRRACGAGHKSLSEEEAPAGGWTARLGARSGGGPRQS